MSRVYFHSKSEESAELRGSERAYAGGFCGDLFAQAVRLSETGFSSETSPLKRILTSNHYARHYEGQQFNNVLRTACNGVASGDLFIVEGKTLDTFSLILNTALIIGGDEVKLLARIHGQCEIHAFVEGQNRKWFAGIIRNGRKSGIYRANKVGKALRNFLKSATMSLS